MMAMRNSRRLALGLAGAALVAACGGSSGPNTNKSVTQQEAGVIADLAGQDLSSSVNGLADFSGGFGGLTGGFFAPGTLGSRAMAKVTRIAPDKFKPAILAFSLDSGCTPAIVGDTTDTDGDGIPNDVTYTFNASNCGYDDGQGNLIALSGTIHIQDADNVTVLFGYAIDFGNWGVAISSNTGQGVQTAQLLLDGTQAAGITSTNAISQEDLTYKVKLNGNQVFKFTSTTSLGFNPTSGTIDPGSQSRLQSGAFDINGRFQYTGDAQTGAAGTWSFGLQTTTPMAYDESCFAESPFTGGQITGSIEANQSAGFIIDYGPNCGDVNYTAFTNGVS